ncbi:MAG: hypothetical protein JNK56_18330 [Myxococcales bacterium]|nr:hypothetical protein [Myxococcales bacterium]
MLQPLSGRRGDGHPERVTLRQRALLAKLHADEHLGALEHQRAGTEPMSCGR